MIKSDSISNLVKALLAAQASFDHILKDKDNPFFKSKYADLAQVIAATQPALIANGLAVSQLPVSTDSRVGVYTILMHTSGEFIGESYTLPMVKQDAQSGVAAVTYARRAGYSGVIGVAAEDDDGETAVGRKVASVAHSADVFVHSARYGRPTYDDLREENSVMDAAARRAGYSGAPASVQLMERAPKVSETPQTNAVNEEQLNVYRDRCVELQKKLSDAGLQSSRNMRIGSKFLMYLLAATSAASVSAISNTQWESFLSVAEAMDINDLVKQINKVVKEKSKEKTENVE